MQEHTSTCDLRLELCPRYHHCCLWPVRDVVSWLLASCPKRSVSWWVMGCLPLSQCLYHVSFLVSFFPTIPCSLLCVHSSLYPFTFLSLFVDVLTTLYQLLSLFDITVTACIPWSHSWLHGNLWVIIENKQFRGNNFPCIKCDVSVAGCHSIPKNFFILLVISMKCSAALEQFWN
jgi:hypothetical protein